MNRGGPTPKYLELYIGSSGGVSEVLHRKRGLGLQMVKRLHDGLHIPYESLLATAWWETAQPILLMPKNQSNTASASNVNSKYLARSESLGILSNGSG